MSKLCLNRRNTMLIALGILVLMASVTWVLNETNLARHFRQLIGFWVMAGLLLLQGWVFGSRYEQLYSESVTDPLTRLYNKRYFREVAGHELSFAKKKGTPFSVAILDVDDFKLYNDARGHLSGDRFLKAIAAIFESSVRQRDVVARFGGDEFIFLLPQTDTEQAAQIMQRIRCCVYKRIGGGVTISIGVATFPADGESLADLINRADRNMYDSKAKCGKYESCLENHLSCRL